MSLVIGGFIAVRFYPMLVDPQGLSSALSKGAGREAGKDLLGYFVNTQHPVIQPLLASLLPIEPFDRAWTNVVFLGYIPMLLAALAIIRKGNRRRLLPWLALALFFLIMRLGSFLTLNGSDYPHIVLPKHFLTEAFPHLFKPFWAVDNFHAGALLPFAVLACYGMAAAKQAVPAKRRLIVILFLTAATAFELYQPHAVSVFATERMEYMTWLREEPDQESIRLINLPFGVKQQKIYGLYQTQNGYPHAAGRPTRTPATAFDYINSNYILSAWNRESAVTCLPGNRAAFIDAQNQLLADGFSHIILHRYFRDLASEARSLLYLQAAYEDDFVSIYRVEDLHLNCSSSAILSRGAPHNLAERYEPGTAWPTDREMVLSMHDYAMTDGLLFDYYSSLDQSSAQVFPLRLENLSGTRMSSSRLPSIDHEAALAASATALFAYDPRHSDKRIVDAYEAWITKRFKACGALTESTSARVFLFARPDVPCALVASTDPLAVQYDNGASLSNLLLERNGTYLDIYFLWNRLPEAKHSISVQFFNADNEKAYNQDFVIRRESLAQHRIDLAVLAPGEYQARMIVYDFETLASVPGEIISSGLRFDRELAISTLTIQD